MLTRSTLADNGAEWVASPFWEAVRALVAAEPQSIPAEKPLPPAEMASPVELLGERRRYVEPRGRLGHVGWPEPPGVWPHIEAAAAVWQARQRGYVSAHNGLLSSVPDLLADQFGPTHTWSASRLENYRTCGFMFFVSSALKLEPRPGTGRRARRPPAGHICTTRSSRKSTPPGCPTRPTGDLDAFVRRIANPILDKAPETEGFRETPWWSQTREEIVDNVSRSIVAPELDQRATTAFCNPRRPSASMAPAAGGRG